MPFVKKIILFIFVVLIAVAAFAAWRIFGGNTGFTEDKKSLFIKSGSNFNDVLNQLADQKIIKNTGTFKWIATQLNYSNSVKPGKYIILKSSSIYQVAKLLKSGRQTPVNLVISKLRTKENLAQKIAGNFECDSASVMALLNNNDTLIKYGLDTNTAMTAVIPNTYSLLWTTPASRIFKKLYTDQEKFWTPERKQKATALNLTPKKAYILASIVEEESTKDEDKGKIASVYLNRLETGMRLSADPTVIFAMKDFSIKRVFSKYTQLPSPYNTYLNSGLPPGPICTPSIKTIDAVLNAPATGYLYFVAQPNLTGFSNFATTYQEHMVFAKQYQQWLNEYLKAKRVP